ncbi:hypothetical protein H7Y40_02075 [Pedobacter sp.]|nr:hypothetical protein [Candidatus Saccharibacteria bacterium]
MTGFNHTLAGTVIALAIQQPLLIAPLAFASHFVMDSLPHFGRYPGLIPYNALFKRYLIGEAILCTAMLSFAISLSPSSWFILALGAAFATLPDFLWTLRNKAPQWTQWFFKFHTVIQWGERPYGWIYELIFTAFLISSLIRLA